MGDEDRLSIDGSFAEDFKIDEEEENRLLKEGGTIPEDEVSIRETRKAKTQKEIEKKAFPSPSVANYAQNCHLIKIISLLLIDIPSKYLPSCLVHLLP